LVDRIDQHARPEARAVLAYAPAFTFELALGGDQAQRALRHAGGAILDGVELRKVAADDLVGRITLDALGAHIPTRDAAVEIEHIDGAVGDAGDQLRELPVGSRQLRAVRLPFAVE